MGLVLKNGVVVGSANIKVLIGGVVVTGIKSIDIPVAQKKENVQAFGAQPVGRGRGAMEYGEVKMELLLEEWKSIVAAAPQRDPFKIPMFDIPIVYDNGTMRPEVLNNAEFTSVGRPYKAGDTAEWLSVGLIYAGLNQ